MNESTYQDLIEVGENDRARIDFCIGAIQKHKASPEVRMAETAKEYDRQKNVTINNYQKMLYKITGEAVKDAFSANHKCASNFFHRFVVQQTQYLLGNGVSFEDENIKKDLGGDKFDIRMKEAGREALIAGVSFGFYNLNTVQIFQLTEFVPLIDEEDGGLKAGIRYWQINGNKPLRFTLYEMDGYTEYIRPEGEEPRVYKDKRPYVIDVRYEGTDTEGEIIDGRNYPSFPIVPFYANENHQSMLVGMRENIDCYDLIKSGFANDLDDASLIYWTLENAGGMDDIDLVRFVERMKTIKAATVDGDGGARAEAHTMDVPYQGRQVYLERLEADLYRDAMALNVNQISGGNITATAIMAAYDPMDGNANEFEDQAVNFIDSILALAGYDDQVKYSFKRSRIANQTEETTMVLAAAQYLDHETILRHMPFLSADEIDGILDRTTAEEAERYQQIESENEQLKAMLTNGQPEAENANQNETPKENTEENDK